MLELHKDRIVFKMSPHEFQTTGNWPSNEDWSRYLDKHYSDQTKWLVNGKDFLSFDETSEALVVKDFIASPKNAYKFVLELLDKAYLLGKPVRGWIHISNYGLINAAIWRFDFKIIGFNGNQLLLERS